MPFNLRNDVCEYFGVVVNGLFYIGWPRRGRSGFVYLLDLPSVLCVTSMHTVFNRLLRVNNLLSKIDLVWMHVGHSVNSAKYGIVIIIPLLLA